MQNPVDVLSQTFGGDREFARVVGRLPSSISNWRRTGIPDASKWQISRELRRRREDGEITQQQFMRAIEALEEESVEVRCA